MKNGIISSLIAACLIGTASDVFSADMSPHARDKQFARTFSKISLEIETIGQLAQTQSQDAKVKELGQKIVQAYTRAGQQVAATAQTAGASKTPHIRGKAAREVRKLAELSGAAFDHAALRQLFTCEQSGTHQLDLETRFAGNAALRQTAALVEADMEPIVWQTAELSSQFNGQP